MSTSRDNHIARSGLVKLQASLIDTKVEFLFKTHCAQANCKHKKGVTNGGRGKL